MLDIDITKIHEMVFRWRKSSKNPKMEDLRNFILASELSGAERNKFAEIALVDYFKRQWKKGNPPAVETILMNARKVFHDESIRIDFTSLKKRLIETELEMSRKTIRFESMLLRFPDEKDFLENCRRENHQWFEERLLPEDAPENADSFRHPSGDVLSLSEDYRVIRYLDRGGQKNVYEVRQASTGQLLVLKESRFQCHDDTVSSSELAQEARLQSRLTHQSVPAIFSLSQTDESNDPVFVERYIRGQSWADVFLTQSFSENIATLARVARVLAYSHKVCHIVHGDVKPDNVMLDDEYGEIYVVDWGMALSLDERSDEKKRYIGGTTVYMPPEIAAGRADCVSPASDVFMLGGILYQIITGKAPYEETYLNEGPQAARRKVRQGAWPPLPSVDVTGRTVPDELAQIVQRSLAVLPQERYAHAGLFADALRDYQSQAELMDRYEAAKTNFQRLRTEVETTQKNYRALSLTLPEQIAAVDEFRRIRELSAEDRELQTSETRMFYTALESEWQSRCFLADQTILLRDYGQTTAILEYLNRMYQHHIEGKPDSFTAGFTQNCQERITQLEHAVYQGMSARRRDRFLKFAFGVAVVFLIGTALWGLRELNGRLRESNGRLRESYLRVAAEKKSVEESARADSQQNEKISAMKNGLTQKITLALADNFAQGALAIAQQAYRIDPNDPLLPAQLEEYSLKTPLPIKTSPCRQIVDMICFSADEKSFATLSPGGILQYWDLKSLAVSQEIKTPLKSALINMSKSGKAVSNGDNSIMNAQMPNVFAKGMPAADTPTAISPFLLDNPLRSGEFIGLDSSNIMVLFDSDNVDNPCVTVNLDDINAVGQDDHQEMTFFIFIPSEKGPTPCLLAGNIAGELLYFSFPDGHLIKKIKGHHAPIQYIATNRQKTQYISCAGDGSMKLWTNEGTLIQDISIPFASSKQFRLRRVDFDPSGKRICAGGETGEIFIWDLEKKKLLSDLLKKKQN
ncbi:MAG: WD40 repeat domain-containing serine/threonine protein kinase [Thermoguttaceae bacterium]|nr:WD40 repeat domain-containing serine/threonine protein kinase [Thermoguttaceae bacterium]